ncbi:uncharacterized protein LOC105702590 isoform X2 [Orussus abietinus]|uniref:uncharacterized protein LOC105702590 isoform X2 n=1 Tax=Orussus abietinus TaxID=222816 RepID=UPI0006251836|nr:uncharacterized protein LOC105702590 isoform X2 [Orussus abietinus]
MSSTVRESSHTSRKIVTHGGPISGQNYSANTTNSLENNLDALLEDLQTSVSRSATPSRGRIQPQVEYRVAANPTRVLSEGRPTSPTRTTTTTTEKYVTTGLSGEPSGIPGLEMLDKELQDVQPGQSKTVAYKQVSYQYNKSLDGKPVDSWAMSENGLNSSGLPLVEEIHETSYEEARPRRLRSPEPLTKTATVSRELLYSDSSSTSPLPSTKQKDVKFIHESSYHVEPRPAQSTVTTVQTNASQEYGNVEYVPVPSPATAVPINLAPGPNTKVTTTIKTYTYELPGAPETYLSGGNLSKGVDQTITYTLPRGSEKTIAYQTSSDSGLRPVSPVTNGSTSPADMTKSTTLHKESKYYVEEHDYQPGRPVSPVRPSGTPSTSVDLKATVTRNERYYQYNYPNGYGPGTDRVDHSNQVAYPGPSPVIKETKSTTIDRVEEHYPSRPPSAGRHPTPDGSHRTTTNYYPTQQSSSSVYKYSNTTSTIPPSRHPDDHEVLLPKPFPTGGVQVYPPKSTSNGQGPPAKLEDLMASFSDSEREVLADISKQEQVQKRGEGPKKEVDFVAHTPPKVKTKNVPGPPVYYPPGSGEFSKKEESSASMSQSGGGWQKASGKYEYEASSKSKSKSSSGKAVVPVCLPLCCALPCVIM